MAYDNTPSDYYSTAIGTIVRLLRQDAVEKCLAGNDTCCFTVAQYQKAYEACTRWPVAWINGLAEKHLRSLPDLVREVQPGIWTAVKANNVHVGSVPE